jgi:hypothetical protein
MSKLMRHFKWFALTLILIFLIFGYVAFPTIHPQLGYAAGAQTSESVAASPAQLVAIRNAQQLLLLQPLEQWVYLPLATR